MTNQRAPQTIQAEPEPRVMCGLPVGGAVVILGSILMICQIFGLFYLSPFMLYFFEISIGSAMMFILSGGAKKRKISYVTAYMLYISMYTFWVFFLILGAILATVYLADNNGTCNDKTSRSSDSGEDTNCTPFTTGDVEMVVISCFFLTVSIVVAIIQIRYLMILYNFLRRCTYRLPTNHSATFNVQYVVPTPISPNGMPPPPRYSVNAPVATATPTKTPMPTEDEQRIATTNSTPILTVHDNLAFGNDEERSRAPSRPPAYSDVVDLTTIPVIEISQHNTEAARDV